MKLKIEINLDNEEVQTSLKDETFPVVMAEYLDNASELIEAMYCEGITKHKVSSPGTFLDNNGVRIGKTWFSF